CFCCCVSVSGSKLASVSINTSPSFSSVRRGDTCSSSFAETTQYEYALQSLIEYPDIFNRAIANYSQVERQRNPEGRRQIRHAFPRLIRCDSVNRDVCKITAHNESEQ